MTGWEKWTCILAAQSRHGRLRKICSITWTLNLDLQPTSARRHVKKRKMRALFTPEQDGLKQEWTGVCWMNPPYGREIGKWVRKAYESALQGDATVVCLLPSRTETAWWHYYVQRAKSEGFADITFLRGRLKFGASKNSAPFPSAIVFFGSQGAKNDQH